MRISKNEKAYKKQRLIVRIGVLNLVGLGCFAYISKNYTLMQIAQKSGSFVWISVLYFTSILLFSFRIIKGAPLRKVTSKAAHVIYLLGAAFLSCCVEEMIWNSQLGNMSREHFLLNFLLEVYLTVGVLVIVGKPVFAYSLIWVLNWVYGLINHYVLVFKGCPPLLGDLKAAGTAATVMGNYEYVLSDSIVWGTLLFLYGLVLISYFPPGNLDLAENKKFCFRKKKYFYRIASALCIAVLGVGIWNIDIGTTFGVGALAWTPVDNFYKFGAPVTMLVSAQDSKLKKPDGYSEKTVKITLENIIDDETVEEESNKKSPSVIVIMNESFADLSVLGDFESEEYLNYFYNMPSYAMRGNTYVSVLGGGTCNSEFEFLTGASMANVKMGVYPYQSYDFSDAENMVKIFQNLGYETVAFHPGGAGNWNRKNVYDELGFDTFYSEEDLENMDLEFISWAVSDKTDYDKVKEIYENRKGPLFLFNVTFQNHGGYDLSLRSDVELVSVGQEYRSYGDVINYLTLVRESDKAFMDLIQYFSEQSEPVVICMFGDHQPTLDSEFLTNLIETDPNKEASVEEKEKRYITPYVIWSNYDLVTEVKDTDMSLNYLGANLMKLLGIHTEYTEYLLDLQKQIPLINSVGYQTKDGIWHSLSEENESLSEYQSIQYYALGGR